MILRRWSHQYIIALLLLMRRKYLEYPTGLCSRKDMSVVCHCHILQPCTILWGFLIRQRSPLRGMIVAGALSKIFSWKNTILEFFATMGGGGH